MVVEGCFDDGAVFLAIQETDDFGVMARKLSISFHMWWKVSVSGGNYHEIVETIRWKLFSVETIKLLWKLILKKNVPACKINYIHD